MFCLASFRRSTKQRESPGTTSTTQTMWAVSTSSARNPLAYSTCWMRRASKKSYRRFTQYIHVLQLQVGIKLVLILLKLLINRLSSFYSSFFPHSFPLWLCISFPHATDETLLAKFKQQHLGNKYFVPTAVMEPAFVIRHFAGKVKYQIKVRTHIKWDQKILNYTVLHLNMTWLCCL